MLRPQLPVDVVDLLPALDRKLIELLKSLTPEEWDKLTIAKAWKVKDVVSHLLNDNIRTLSILRDQYPGEGALFYNETEQAAFLNELNADWIKAMKPISPAVLILLYETTGQLYCNYFKTLHPFGKTNLTISWAGESGDQNWMYIAKEYAERFLYQQYIREAVNKQGLMVPAFFYPFIDTFALSLPYIYRNVAAEEGSVMKLTITSTIGGSWFLIRINDQWQLNKRIIATPSAELILDPDTAWKLFSGVLSLNEAKDKITMQGDLQLAEVALTIGAVLV